MGTWRVDPDRVVGILAGVDVEGETLARASRNMDALSSASTSGLAPDGHPGDPNALVELLYPGWPTSSPVANGRPDRERPDDLLPFGEPPLTAQSGTR